MHRIDSSCSTVLKIQSLLPSRPSEALVEGEPPPGHPLHGWEHHPFIPGLPAVNRRLAYLHSTLQSDPSAQVHIDRHLACAALAAQGHKPDLRWILRPEDAPQLANLPDIGEVIREGLTTHRWGGSLVARLLQTAMPCPRQPPKPAPSDAHSYPVLLNLLLATCLGLHPGACKRPPFATRVALFARVHALLTSPLPEQAAFAARHPSLLQIALSEHVAHTLPAYMPAEHQALCKAFPVQAFFTAAPQLLDAFRQDHIDTGAEPWGTLEAAAHGIHERLCRTYKSKCRAPAPPRRAHLGDATPRDLRAAMDLPRLLPYPCHAGGGGAMAAEYRVLQGEGSPFAHVAVADVHALAGCHPLPHNLTRWQLSVVRDAEQRCMLRTAMRRTKHLCLHCERKGRKAELRLCTRTGCVVCKNDPPGEGSCVVAVDTVGCVLQLRSAQYIFAPCCGTVQRYMGDGLDFAQPRHGEAGCRHAKTPRPEPRRQRVLCAMCDGPALPCAHPRLDTATARMASTFLCQRHTPPEDWLARCANRGQLEVAARDWDRLMRELHRRG